VLLYDDPNNDGNPSDAVLLSSSGAENFGVGDSYSNVPYAKIPIGPTYVGSAGESFFVGAYAQCDALSLHLFWGNYTPGNPLRSWYFGTAPGELHPAEVHLHTPSQISNTVFTLRAYAVDCNGNGVWDECDIGGGFSPDVNGDGIPDECQPACGADIAPKGGGNGVIDIDDLLVVINFWGATGVPGSVPGDITRNGVVDIDDLLEIINSWGPCV
jgi:hypothetical protein